MDSERFVLLHPVRAQRQVRDLCNGAEEATFQHPAIVVVLETESDIDLQEAIRFSHAFRTAASQVEEGLTTYACSEPSLGKEVVLVAWSSGNAGVLIELLSQVWAELQRVSNGEMRMFGAIGQKDYAAICTLRMAAAGNVAIDDAVFTELSESSRQMLVDLGYKRIAAGPIKNSIWAAFLKEIESENPTPSYA